MKKQLSIEDMNALAESAMGIRTTAPEGYVPVVGGKDRTLDPKSLQVEATNHAVMSILGESQWDWGLPKKPSQPKAKKLAESERWVVGVSFPISMKPKMKQIQRGLDDLADRRGGTPDQTMTSATEFAFNYTFEAGDANTDGFISWVKQKFPQATVHHDENDVMSDDEFGESKGHKKPKAKTKGGKKSWKKKKAMESVRAVRAGLAEKANDLLMIALSLAESKGPKSANVANVIANRMAPRVERLIARLEAAEDELAADPASFDDEMDVSDMPELPELIQQSDEMIDALATQVSDLADKAEGDVAAQLDDIADKLQNDLGPAIDQALELLGIEDADGDEGVEGDEGEMGGDALGDEPKMGDELDPAMKGESKEAKRKRILESVKSHGKGRIRRLREEGEGKFKLSKTYEVWTPEDMEAGSASDHGFEYEDNEFDSLEDLAREIQSEGSVEASQSISKPPYDGVWFSTTDGDQDLETGGMTNYGFHPEGLSDADWEKLFSLLKIKKWGESRKPSKKPVSETRLPGQKKKQLSESQMPRLAVLLKKPSNGPTGYPETLKQYFDDVEDAEHDTFRTPLESAISKLRLSRPKALGKSEMKALGKYFSKNEIKNAMERQYMSPEDMEKSLSLL